MRVNDTSYSRGDLVKALRVRQEGARFFGLDFQPSQEIFEALQLFVEDEILTQVAAKYGITVLDDEIDRQIESLFLIGEPGLDPEALRRDFDERYRSYLNAVRLSEGEHREITRRSILRAKFREFIGEQVSRFSEQVHFHRIVMPVGSEVDIMLVKLKDGLAEATTPEQRQQVWKEIVREFSIDDPETVRLGGDRGWHADQLNRYLCRDHSQPRGRRGQRSCNRHRKPQADPVLHGFREGPGQRTIAIGP